MSSVSALSASVMHAERRLDEACREINGALPEHAVVEFDPDSRRVFVVEERDARTGHSGSRGEGRRIARRAQEPAASPHPLPRIGVPRCASRATPRCLRRVRRCGGGRENDAPARLVSSPCPHRSSIPSTPSVAPSRPRRRTSRQRQSPRSTWASRRSVPGSADNGDMSTQRQPKGIPVGGEFASNSHDEAGGSLVAPAEPDIFAEIAQPLTAEEAMEMVSNPDRYNTFEPFVVSGRFVDIVPPKPSLRIDRDRPTFTDEKEFAYALSRIDGLWSKDDSIDGRSERIIADMRRSGALGSGASSAREAYARALVLNEAGYIDEEQVNHLLNHIEAGGVDYKNQARSFGYHPEQFLSDIQSAADAAAYRADHAGSDDARRAAIHRAGILDVEARRFASSANRGWTSLEEDTNRYRNAVRVLDEKLAGDLSAGAKDKRVAAVIDRNNRIDITAERDAYAFMLNKIEGRWTND